MGQQGAGKSTLSLWLRTIIDPSKTPLLGETRSGELSRLFQYHAVPCFENMGYFSRHIADAFCRATTGNGVDQRKLQTDSDSVLRRYRRPILINALNTPSMHPDFLDRSIVVEFPRLEKYEGEKYLKIAFEAACPELLGALLDLTVKVLCLRDEIPAPTEFRMADFAHIGRAVAKAIGKTPEDFDTAYRLNIQQRDVELLDASPMIRLLKKFATRFSKSTPWTGTMTELLSCLEKVAIDTNDSNARKNLPKAENWLSRRISELAPALLTDNIVIEPLPRQNARRPWRLFKKVSTIAMDASDAVRKEIEGGNSHE